MWRSALLVTAILTLPDPAAATDFDAIARDLAQHRDRLVGERGLAPLSTQDGARFLDQVRDIARQTGERHAPTPRRDQPKTYLFLSAALGPAVDEAFALAAGREVEIVFRGPMDGESLGSAIRRLGQQAARFDPPPKAMINPTLFLKHGVDVVPTVVVERAGSEVARMRGTLTPDTLLSKLDAGEGGDLGAVGPVVAIVEPDLIATMQARAAALDFDAIKAGALKRQWDRVTTVDLPLATVARRRSFDPSVRVSRDITLVDGAVLRHEGETVNPLDVMPFNQRLVVFDATDPRQMALARRLGGEAGGKRVTYLTTAVDRESGWDGFNRLQAGLGAALYILPPAMQRRFRLEAVPAVVEADGPVMVVTELPVQEK